MTTKKYKDLRQRILEYTKDRKRLIYWGQKVKTLQTTLLLDPKFKDTQLYKDICSATDFLGKDIPIWFRVKAIMLDCDHIEKCSICGKDAKMFIDPKATVPVFRQTCGSPHCLAISASSQKKAMTEHTRQLHQQSQLKAKQEIRCLGQKLLDKNQLDVVNVNIEKLQQFAKQKAEEKHTNAVMVTKADYEVNSDILRMLLKQTSFIDVPNKISEVKELRWNERLYCILNNITSLPRCKFCGQPVKFIRFSQGYLDSCSDCHADRYREKHGYKTSAELSASIDSERYEVLYFPSNFQTEPLQVKCKKCGYVSEVWWRNGHCYHFSNDELCKNCGKYSSHKEHEVRDFISRIYDGPVKYNTHDVIPPMELDIYLPEKKLAIEFDGLYYHSSDVVKPNYHILKTSKCEQNGIQLLHVFENEWNDKKEIVKSRLSDLLGGPRAIVFARRCIVNEVSTKESREFQEKNHLQGAVNASVKLGLYHDDELVSLMTFGKTRFSKKHQWELLRFCSKCGYHVPGAAGKLLKHFEENWHPKSLVSYADRRWSIGKLYFALGFNCIRKTSPNYWYFRNERGIKLLSRIMCQKHRLSKLLSAFDPDKSEHENMKANGYKCIYDCGNLVFEKIYV